MNITGIKDLINSLYKPMILMGVIAYGLFMITAILAFKRKMKIHKIFALIALGMASIHAWYLIVYTVLNNMVGYITLIKILGFITYGLFIMTLILGLSKKFKLHKIFAIAGFTAVFLHLFLVIFNLY